MSGHLRRFAMGHTSPTTTTTGMWWLLIYPHREL